MIHGIERARTDKRFDYAPVYDAFIDPMAEIEQIKKRPLLLTRPDNRLFP